MISNSTSIQSKKHYQILDGLRGIAAIIVVVFHLLEAFSGGNRFIQLINHGYLAVDFFFLLSGFVIAYAYDDRWDKITTLDFLKRRMIRLHPMLIFGTAVGAIMYYFQASDIVFPMIENMPIWKLVVAFVIGCTLLPMTPSTEIRGWGEMHPLVGPAWSLYFEYIGNILYVLFFRRCSIKVLVGFVTVFAIMLINLTVFGDKGDVIGGWSLNAEQMNIGFTRLLFPFFAGILLSRLGKLFRVGNAFYLCAILLTLVLVLPRFGNENSIWINGLYEALCIMFVFPLIVLIGAGSDINNPLTEKFCKFLGDISYPLYIIHYPFIYWYFSWVADNNITLENGIVCGVIVLIINIALAYIALRFYDIPIRKYLQKRFKA